MRQAKPLPPSFPLAPTLARRVHQLREFRNLTIVDLAKLSRFSKERIEDIESGLESWLSSAERQLLAKALSVEACILQEVETRSGLGTSAEQEAAAAALSKAILNGGRDLECPNCGHTLRCSVQVGMDIDGQTIKFAKAFCSVCPFILR